jgi:hypothetical protein
MRLTLLFLFSLTLLKTLLTSPDTTVLPVDPPDPLNRPIVIEIDGSELEMSAEVYSKVVACVSNTDKKIIKCYVTLSELPASKYFSNIISLRPVTNGNFDIETVSFQEAPNSKKQVFQELLLNFYFGVIKFDNCYIKAEILTIEGSECSFANSTFLLSKFEPACKEKIQFFHSQIEKYDNDGSKDIPFIFGTDGPVDRIFYQIDNMHNSSGD